MAFTGQLGTSDSMLGQIELGLPPALLGKLPTRVLVEAQLQTSVAAGFPGSASRIIPSRRTSCIIPSRRTAAVAI